MENNIVHGRHTATPANANIHGLMLVLASITKTICMLTSLVVLGIFLLVVIIYIVWPYRKNKDSMKGK